MKQNLLVYLLICVWLQCLQSATYAANDSVHRQTAPSLDSLSKDVQSASVAPFGTEIFRMYAAIGPFSPAKRARLTEQQIKIIASIPFYHTDSIKIFKSDIAYAIMYEESIINSIFEEDARAEGLTREEVARNREVKIITAIQQHRHLKNFGEILKNAGFSVGILVLYIIFIILLNRLFRMLSKRMTGWQSRIMKLLRLKEYEFFNRQRQLSFLLISLNILRWVIILLLLMVTFIFIFYLLPWTKEISIRILEAVINPLRNILQSFWQYLPNLVTILVILFVTRLIIRLFKFLKVEVEKGTLKIPGFYSDWALPTFNILRVLIIIFTLVAIWPYLPGSGSQVFQGVSVFFGLMFSLTSASALSNFMAGLTLTYTRAFKLGDRVKIGDVTGDIIEKSMIVTKIRTIKNEEITVPNNKIMNSEVINYSTCAPDLGLIMHTTVTIGYDAPWRQVHQLLIDAAINTGLIISTPKPFVLQTALNDFYITYQLNAYTRSPNEMAVIFSNLHQNIQDSFNNAGVEIMSPHYKSVRDGNTIAIPEENRAIDYVAPAFRVENNREE
ncbi:MAG: mechanosensitive ion channel domain-containing protein [bacterium]